MRICTITCHDVYNSGASLQAFALQQHLEKCGHETQIIDYKPDYLSYHYSLSIVNNSVYDKPIIRELYLLAKLPGRMKRRRSRKKLEFDQFRNEFLKCTEKTYSSYEELCSQPPVCDAMIAGSDQIWNPLFKNGKDPAFFLQFGDEDIKRISYAASFAVNSIATDDVAKMQKWLQSFDYISVREKSGLDILRQLGYTGENVCDPVFLLDSNEWLDLADAQLENRYVFVYDFDHSELIDQILKELKEEDIVSYFPSPQADVVDESGPIGFIRNIAAAKLVVSNSFHATSFALMFHKPFCVIERKEQINTRMIDLLDCVGLKDRIVRSVDDLDKIQPIDWNEVDQCLNDYVMRSKLFLCSALKEDK